MKKLKKTISVLLSLLMLLSLCSTAALAAETDKQPTGGGGPSVFVEQDRTTVPVYTDYDGVNNDAVEGVTYDVEKNTATLNNVQLSSDSVLKVFSLNEDFKLEVIGDCFVSRMEVHDTCLNIVGSGSITLATDSDYAIQMDPWMHNYYPATIDIGENVTMKASAAESAVHIERSTHPDEDTVMTVGGTKSAGLFDYESTSEEANETFRAVIPEETDVYLAKNSAYPDQMFIADEWWGNYRVHSAVYDDDFGTYVYDRFEYDDVDADDFESEGYSFYKGDKESSKSTCVSLYISDFNLYLDAFENKYVDYYNDYCIQNKDRTIVFNGEELPVFELVEELTSELTPVKYTRYIYTYTYPDSDLSILPNIRGKVPGIYLDGEETVSIYDGEGVHVKEASGIKYDEVSKTLALENVDLSECSLSSYFIDSLTLEIKGNCSLKSINVYDGSLHIKGDGKLTVSGADYGVSVEPLNKEYSASQLCFVDDDLEADISGSVSAFRVLKTTAGDYAATIFKTPIQNLTKSDEASIKVNRKVSGAYLESWSGGVGFRYKVVKDDDPEGIYVCQYSTTTHMDAYGRPSYTVENYDLKKCYYDETADANIIEKSIGVLDGDEFESQGYSRIAGSSYYTGYQMASAYYLNDVTAEGYADSDGASYAVSDGKVYSYSENKKITSSGSEVYLFESSDKELSDLTAVQDDYAYYSYTYNGTNYVKGKYVPTEPTSETESVPATESVEPTATEPVAQASDIWVGGVKVTESNASNITGSGISGKISYNAATNTLTLENAEITSAYEEEAEGGNSNPFVGGIFSKNSLNIELIGENTIEVTDAVPSESKNYNLYGVIVKGNLTISGSGKLTTEGMCGNSLNIKKDADVNSTVSVGMRVRIRNAVTFETIKVEGKLYAKCSTVFLDYPAVVTKNFTVCEGAEVTVYASNVIPSTPSPYAAKCISIMNGGTLTVNGDLSVTAEGTIAGDSSSSQKNNGYGIYGESDNCTVVLGNTGNLTASGKASAVRNITFSIPSDLFVIKAGSSEENAEETELSGINSQKYISFETTYVPPVTEPATTTTDEPTTPGEEPTTPDEKKDISGWTVEGLKNVAYTGKVIKQELHVVSSDGEYAEFKTVYKNNKKVGTATVIITGTGAYAGTITKTFKITKAKQSMTAKAVSKSVKLKDVKKKNVTVKKAITVKKNHGSVSYAKVSKGSSKYLTISKKGVITFKKWKKAKKGTYKIVVNVTAKGNTNYKKLSKKVTVKIKVK